MIYHFIIFEMICLPNKFTFYASESILIHGENEFQVEIENQEMKDNNWGPEYEHGIVFIELTLINHVRVECCFNWVELLITF